MTPDNKPADQEARKPYTSIPVFETRDGKRHDEESHAAEWAQWLDDLDAANEMLADGANVLDSLRRAYQQTPYRFNQEAWATLGRITNQTKLVISHWQCQDDPCYRVERIKESGALRVGGAGGWSGYYSNDVGPADLVRYAENTLARGARTTGA